MKKIITGIAIFSMLLVFSPTPSKAYTPNWDVTGDYEWVVLGIYHHDLNLIQSADGTFTGTGGYKAGLLPYLTTEVISGYVDGDNITLTTTYDGPYNPGYTVTVHGTINGDGYISGTSPWNWYMVEHAVVYDLDGDGVFNQDDLCPGTVMDSPYGGIGTNRWYWDGYTWQTETPNKNEKGALNRNKQYTMEETQGCSCSQILEKLETATGGEFEGHWKYGCSKSVIEDWIDGKYYLETVEVPANDADGVTSLMSSIDGQDYFLKASGTAFACNQPGCVIEFDAEYSTSDNGLNWVDGVAPPYNSYGLDLLDLKVDDSFVDWGAYDSEHTYQLPYTGTGNPLGLGVYDLAGSYFNDTGSLFVDIFAKLW